MNPREEFFITDEFFRYSAECRRLARLARRPPSEIRHGIGPTLYRALVERLADIQGRTIHQPKLGLEHRLAPGAVASHR
jgi:hypothetical protein